MDDLAVAGHREAPEPGRGDGHVLELAPLAGYHAGYGRRSGVCGGEADEDGGFDEHCEWPVLLPVCVGEAAIRNVDLLLYVSHTIAMR